MIYELRNSYYEDSVRHLNLHPLEKSSADDLIEALTSVMEAMSSHEENKARLAIMDLNWANLDLRTK